MPTMVFQVLICKITRKWFLDALKPEKLAKMANLMGDNSGYAQTIFAYKESEEKEVKIFVGRTQGRIVEPRGSRKFGWDCVFLPDGEDGTYGELDGERKNKISQRKRALVKLLKYFEE